MPQYNYGTVGDLQDYEFLRGTIKSIDTETDTCTVEVSGSVIDALLFYHCEPESAQRENGAIEGAAAGFAEDDAVIVQVKYDMSEVRVIAHLDGVRHCGWENWSGPLMNSRHPWVTSSVSWYEITYLSTSWYHVVTDPTDPKCGYLILDLDGDDGGSDQSEGYRHGGLGDTIAVTLDTPVSIPNGQMFMKYSASLTGDDSLFPDELGIRMSIVDQHGNSLEIPLATVSSRSSESDGLTAIELSGLSDGVRRVLIQALVFRGCTAHFECDFINFK